MSTWISRLSRLIPTGLWWGTLLIIIGLPFHVLVYSLLLTPLPHLASLFKDWKEALVVVMTLAAGLLVALRPEFWRAAWRRFDFWLIAAFTLLNLLFGLSTPDKSAAILAIKINVVFLLLFVAASFVDFKRLKSPERRLTQALLIPAAIVGLFGLAQLWLLPNNFLTHFGYGSGPNQIAPFVMLNATIVRIQSFLFGPNQFGSYLVLPTVLATWLLWRQKRWGARLALGALIAVLIINLYGTQSRGSWLGLVAGLFALGWLGATKRLRLILVTALIICAGLFVALIPTIEHSHLNTQILHGSSIDTAGASDQLHLQRLEDGIRKLGDHPLGQGLTAAGRASDLTGDSFFTENFYLQIGDQIGIEGLLLLLAILVVVGWRLFQASAAQPFARPLLAALVGISVMNLFAHTWSDGATALLWWGSAGIILGLGAANPQKAKAA